MEKLQRGVGIRFKGREREDVENIGVGRLGFASPPARPSIVTACRFGQALRRGRDLVARSARGPAAPESG